MGVRLNEEQTALLNQKLAQLGYSILGELVGGLPEGVVTNKQVVEELANTLADRVVNKMLTVQSPATDATQAVKSVRSLFYGLQGSARLCAILRWADCCRKFWYK